MKDYIEKLGLVSFNQESFDEMVQYNLAKDSFLPATSKIEGLERPPIEKIPEYRQKFRTSGLQSIGADG